MSVAPALVVWSLALCTAVSAGAGAAASGADCLSASQGSLLVPTAWNERAVIRLQTGVPIEPPETTRGPIYPWAGEQPRRWELGAKWALPFRLAGLALPEQEI